MEPADRSVLPVMISNVMPQAMIVTTEVWVRRLMIFACVRNTLDMHALRMTNMIKMKNMPTLLYTSAKDGRFFKVSC